MKKQLTNEEFIVELLNFSPYGGLAQAFIVEAIRHYSQIVAETPIPTDNGGFINPVAWHGIAVDIKERMEKQYSSQGVPV